MQDKIESLRRGQLAQTKGGKPNDDDDAINEPVLRT
jgi:hypothetical protein